jgi:hypothetical protein
MLCEGDDLADLIVWAAKGADRPERIRFYFEESLRPGTPLQTWAASGLGMPRIDAFTDQASLSARIGQDIVQRIADDFGPPVRRPPL